MLEPVINKNDKKAWIVIMLISAIVFGVVAVLSKEKPHFNFTFNVHIFATFNAVINTVVALILVVAIIAVKQKKYLLHKKLMLSAMVLSALFLISYIIHHLIGGETKYGGTGVIKAIYLIILLTHILLAAIILPFILFTTYRALIGEFDKHKKLARITYPIWLYVAVTGPIIYLMISPYYV